MKHLILIFGVVLSFTLNAKENTFYEKAAGNAFSGFSEVKNAYLYNPAVLGYNKGTFISPLKAEMGMDSAVQDFWFRGGKYEDIPTPEKVLKIRKVLKDPASAYWGSDVSTSGYSNNFAYALHVQMETGLDTTGGTINISTIQTVKLYFAHGIALGDFSLGYTVKPSFSFAHKSSQIGINYDKALSKAHAEGAQLVDLHLTFGAAWRKTFLTKHEVQVGTSFNNIPIHLMKKRAEPSTNYDLEVFKGRLSAGVVSDWSEIKLMTKVFSTVETDFKTYASHHFGTSLKFLDLLDFRFGFENLSYTMGFFVVNKYVELGVGTSVVRSKYLLKGHEARTLTFSLGGSFKL